MNSHFLANLSMLFSLLPLLAFIFIHPKLDATLKIILVYVILSILTEILGFYTSRHKINNQFIFELYTYLEAVLVILFFRSINKNPIINRLILFSLLFTGICGCLFFYCSLPHELVFVSCSLLIVLLCLRQFHVFFNEASILWLPDNSLFWFISSFLLYFCTTIFLTLFDSTLREFDGQLQRTVWSFHNTINIFYNITLTIGLWKTRKN